MLVSIAGVSKYSCYQAGHPQKEMPVAKEFTTLSVRLWLVDWRGSTVLAFSHRYSRALVFFFTQSCQNTLPRVARLLNKKIQKFYMCMQYYYCIKEVRGNAGLIGATGVFLCLYVFQPPLCARKVFIAYFTIGITVTFA